MDPQQELFTELRNLLVQHFGDGKVFDGRMPPESTPYPFVYLADSYQLDVQTKSKLNGRVVQTIHVWHNSPMKRGTLSKMMSEVKQIVRSVEADGTAAYGWVVEDMSQRILTDTTTKTPLLHGVVEATLYFN